MAEEDYLVRKELDEKTVRMRWMDDLVVAAEVQLSRGARRALRVLTGKGSYGEGLELVRTQGSEAFGFQWRAKGATVEVFPDEKWLNPFDKLWGIRRKGTLLDGRSASLN